MTRSKALIGYALIALVLAGLFVAFIAFKGDASLIAALEAAGAVSAAGFAAIAAMGSMRAAAESSATARRSREALARTMRPRIEPSIIQENGTVLGKVERGEGHAAVDVTVAWIFATDHDTVTDQAPRLETSSAVDLGLPVDGNAWTELRAVWIEYWDDARAGHWRDTWEIKSEHGQGRLVLTHSDLVD